MVAAEFADIGLVHGAGLAVPCQTGMDMGAMATARESQFSAA